MMMAKDPWTDPDPQPGDFDAYLAKMDPRDVQVVEAGSGAKVKFLVRLDGEDAARLGQLARERGQDIDEVVADLVRSAA